MKFEIKELNYTSKKIAAENSEFVIKKNAYIKSVFILLLIFEFITMYDTFTLELST